MDSTLRAGRVVTKLSEIDFLLINREEA